MCAIMKCIKCVALKFELHNIIIRAMKISIFFSYIFGNGEKSKPFLYADNGHFRQLNLFFLSIVHPVLVFSCWHDFIACYTTFYILRIIEKFKQGYRKYIRRWDALALTYVCIWIYVVLAAKWATMLINSTATQQPIKYSFIFVILFLRKPWIENLLEFKNCTYNQNFIGCIVFNLKREKKRAHARHDRCSSIRWWSMFFNWFFASTTDYYVVLIVRLHYSVSFHQRTR